MTKFNKGYNLRILALAVALIFGLTDFAYSLRVPMGKYGRIIDFQRSQNKPIKSIMQLSDQANKNRANNIPRSLKYASFIPSLNMVDLKELFSRGNYFNEGWARIALMYVSGDSLVIGDIDPERLDTLITVVRALEKQTDLSFYLLEYLNLVRTAKSKNIDICTYISPEYNIEIGKVIEGLPGELLKRIGKRVKFFDFDMGEGNIAGSAVSGTVKIASDMFYRQEEMLLYSLRHEFMHILSMAIDAKERPLFHVFFWKRAAQLAGFKYVFLDNRLVPVEDLSNNVGDFIKIRNEDWIYESDDGRLLCYLLDENRYNECKTNSKYKDNGIELKLFSDIKKRYWKDYWKISPGEALAVAGAKYMEDSEGAINGTLKGINNELSAIAKFLSGTLFIIRLEDGEFYRYVFANNGEKQLVKLSAQEWDDVGGRIMLDRYYKGSVRLAVFTQIMRHFNRDRINQRIRRSNI